MYPLCIQASSGVFINIWQLSLGKKKRPSFPLFPDFHAVNTLTMAKFKLQHESLNTEWGKARNIQCSCDLVNTSSTTTSLLKANGNHLLVEWKIIILFSTGVPPKSKYDSIWLKAPCIYTLYSSFYFFILTPGSVGILGTIQLPWEWCLKDHKINDQFTEDKNWGILWYWKI